MYHEKVATPEKPLKLRIFYHRWVVGCRNGVCKDIYMQIETNFSQESGRHGAFRPQCLH